MDDGYGTVDMICADMDHTNGWLVAGGRRIIIASDQRWSNTCNIFTTLELCINQTDQQDYRVDYRIYDEWWMKKIWDWQRFLILNLDVRCKVRNCIV